MHKPADLVNPLQEFAAQLKHSQVKQHMGSLKVPDTLSNRPHSVIWTLSCCSNPLID